MNIAINFSNPFVLIFLIGTIASFFIHHFLEFIDYKARKKNGGTLPKELQEIPAANVFDQEKLKKISEYENAKYFAWIHSSVCNLVLDFALILFGFYPFIFDKTDVALASESNSSFWQLKDVKSPQLATMSFGQRFEIYEDAICCVEKIRDRILEYDRNIDVNIVRDTFII